MNRAMLERHLTQAKERVVRAGRYIAYQRELIADLERDGHDATELRRLLANFEVMQEMHVEGWERIQQALAQNW